MDALSLVLSAACLTLDETGPDGLRDAVESLHDAAVKGLVVPRVARAAVDVIALHVDDCVFQFICDGMGAEAYDEVSAAIGKFRWDFPRDDV